MTFQKSDSIKEIGKALGVFHAKCDTIKKDATNPFFKSKYASLSNILDIVQMPLLEAGLTFAQYPDDDDCLTSILIHGDSGEWMQASYKMRPSQSNPQGIGSAITYARRYALGAILGLNIDEDDDGNAASAHPQAMQNHNIQRQETENALPWMSDKQFKDALTRMQGGEKDLLQKLKTALRIKKEYREALENAMKQPS